MFKSNKLAVLAALLSLLMLVSMLAVVPAFADDTAAETTVEETAAASETADAVETTAAVSDSESTAGEGTEAATKQETTTAPTTTGSNEKDDGEKDYTGLINLIVGGVILLVLAILCIKFRNKIPTWWKGLKSECGKITWCPKDKLKKNTIVVIIIIVAIAVVIGVLDFVFSRGMFLLRGLFNK